MITERLAIRLATGDQILYYKCMETIDLKKKTCTKCGQEKTELDFYPNAAKPGGLASWCKECMKEEKREWYKHNKETQKRRTRKGREETKEGVDPTYGKHACNRCGKCEPDVVFNLRKYAGRYYKRHLCTKCFAEYKREKNWTKNKPGPEIKRRNSLRSKIRRKKPELTANHILTSCKGNDKRKGRENDLDLEFVRELTKGNICAYCGETTLRITLDRIDNNLGHLKTNVIAACIRCNGIRCNMPFEAWKFIIPKIRAARIKGLFGDWQGRRLLHVIEDSIPPDVTLWTAIEAA